MTVNATVASMIASRRAHDEARRHCPPMAVLDKIADEKLSGGFNTKRSNVCDGPGGCFQVRSVNGKCGCPS